MSHQVTVPPRKSRADSQALAPIPTFALLLELPVLQVHMLVLT